MTLYLNFRTQAVGGPVADQPYVLSGDGTANPPALSPVKWTDMPSLVTGHNVLFMAHGFHVNYQQGACTFGNAEAYLRGTGKLRPGDLFIGVLWPGDAWLPYVDYPFEGDVAIQCGKLFAAFCNRWMTGARGLTFASHSLGARVVLQAIAGLDFDKPVCACLMAGAVNRDCLEQEYAAAAEKCQSISLLASWNDLVLKLAYPAGDAIADILHDDHTPFESALGLHGPRLPVDAKVRAPWQIPDSPAYNHGDYLPPDSGPLPAMPPSEPLWVNPIRFVGNAFQQASQSWP